MSGAAGARATAKPARRPPLLATLIVVAAVATMIGLGVWQLQRKAVKEALLARVEQNRAKPPISILSDEADYMDDDSRYRPVVGSCDRVLEWQVEGGRARNGESGYRYFATCASKPFNGSQSQRFVVDLGVSKSPTFRPNWKGGDVQGWLSTIPQHFNMLERTIGKIPVPTPLLVSYSSPPGLVPTREPTTTDIPNNHLFYAMQWFFFAAAAAVIYVLALRRRSR